MKKEEKSIIVYFGVFIITNILFFVIDPPFILFMLLYCIYFIGAIAGLPCNLFNSKKPTASMIVKGLEEEIKKFKMSLRTHNKEESFVGKVTGTPNPSNEVIKNSVSSTNETLELRNK